MGRVVRLSELPEVETLGSSGEEIEAGPGDVVGPEAWELGPARRLPDDGGRLGRQRRRGYLGHRAAKPFKP
jgi:hypothetical protein